MSVELVQAIGLYIVCPIVVGCVVYKFLEVL